MTILETLNPKQVREYTLYYINNKKNFNEKDALEILLKNLDLDTDNLDKIKNSEYLLRIIKWVSFKQLISEISKFENNQIYGKNLKYIKMIQKEYEDLETENNLTFACFEKTKNDITETEYNKISENDNFENIFCFPNLINYNITNENKDYEYLEINGEEYNYKTINPKNKNDLIFERIKLSKRILLI